MTINCIGDCGAAYLQDYPGLLFDDNLIAAGWEHTPRGWLCADCCAEQKKKDDRRLYTIIFGEEKKKEATTARPVIADFGAFLLLGEKYHDLP